MWWDYLFVGGFLMLDRFCVVFYIFVLFEGGGFVGIIDCLLVKLGYKCKVIILLFSFLLVLFFVV